MAIGNNGRYGSSNTIRTLALPDPTVLVLADGATSKAIDNARGHLFEQFVAHLFHIYGYNEPTRERLELTSNGIELDLSAEHELTHQRAIAECKAYTSPVKAGMLGTFHSKIVIERYNEPSLQGFFIVLPRLTPNGEEQAKTITDHDRDFKLITARGIVELLKLRHTVVDCPLPNIRGSDPAVLITKEGIFAACHELDAITRTTFSSPRVGCRWTCTVVRPRDFVQRQLFTGLTSN